MVIEGAMTGEMFLAYVEQCLVPTLRRNDIVVMDNCRVHMAPAIREAIEKARATLRGAVAAGKGRVTGRYRTSSRKARAALIQLNVGCPDDLGPFLGILGDELCELGGRTRKHLGAQIGQPDTHQLVEKLEKLVEAYKLGTLGVEVFFEALKKFVAEMEEEERRAAREGPRNRSGGGPT
jgi:hypothetical protein